MSALNPPSNQLSEDTPPPLSPPSTRQDPLLRQLQAYLDTAPALTPPQWRQNFPLKQLQRGSSAAPALSPPLQRQDPLLRQLQASSHSTPRLSPPPLQQELFKQLLTTSSGGRLEVNTEHPPNRFAMLPPKSRRDPLLPQLPLRLPFQRPASLSAPTKVKSDRILNIQDSSVLSDLQQFMGIEPRQHHDTILIHDNSQLTDNIFESPQLQQPLQQQQAKQRFPPRFPQTNTESSDFQAMLNEISTKLTALKQQPGLPPQGPRLAPPGPRLAQQQRLPAAVPGGGAYKLEMDQCRCVT